MQIVSEILSKSDNFSMLMGDILRVLSLSFGRLWLSELIMEIEGFRSSFGEVGKVNADDVADAVDNLERLNVLQTEKRLRSSMLSGSIPDLMVTLLNLSSVLTIVRNDPRFLQYMRLKDAAFKDLRGK